MAVRRDALVRKGGDRKRVWSPRAGAPRVPDQFVPVPVAATVELPVLVPAPAPPAPPVVPPRPTRPPRFTRTVRRSWPGRLTRRTTPVAGARGRHVAPPDTRHAWQGRYRRVVRAGDLVIGLAAGTVAFGLRFGTGVTAYNRGTAFHWGYAVASLLLPVALALSLTLHRAYERRYLFVGSDEYQRVLRAGMTLAAAIALVSFALDVRLARGYVLVALAGATLACVLLRFGVRKRLHWARARGGCLSRVIVVGHRTAVLAMTRQLGRERYHGFEVVGCCLPAVPAPDRPGLPVFGTFDEVGAAVRAARADTVIVLSCPELDGVVLRRLAWRLERDDIDLIVGSSRVDVAGTRTTIRPVDGLPMMHVEHARLDGAGWLAKAVFDRLGAAVLLVLASPLLAVLAVAVTTGSPGPVLFRQVRVGKDGREFLMYKFRSMRADAEARLAEVRHLNEQDGVLFKVRQDPRVTSVGRWMRRLSLDELPQLINVLRGQMSLVGPRPPLPREVAGYPADMRRRLAVRPGMTGLWQVSGRSDLSFEEAVRLDLRYVENWSFSLDLVILLRTLAAVCRASGAY